MGRGVAALMVVAALLPSEAWAVGKNKAKYVGGTVSVLPADTEGALGTSDPEKMVFVAEKGGGLLEIQWDRIVELEYGQKVGRRWKSAILLSPIAIFLKGRKHFLTVTYKDAQGGDQAAIFELGKDIVRTTLTIAETRAGRKVIFQDEEAAKARAN